MSVLFLMCIGSEEASNGTVFEEYWGVDFTRDGEVAEHYWGTEVDVDAAGDLESIGDSIATVMNSGVISLPVEEEAMAEQGPIRKIAWHAGPVDGIGSDTEWWKEEVWLPWFRIISAARRCVWDVSGWRRAENGEEMRSADIGI